jgi:hypothetical protein
MELERADCKMWQLKSGSPLRCWSGVKVTRRSQLDPDVSQPNLGETEREKIDFSVCYPQAGQIPTQPHLICAL